MSVLPRTRLTDASSVPKQPLRSKVALNLQLQQLRLSAVLHRFAAGQTAHILWSAQIRQQQDAQAMVQRLHDGGMPTLDISGIEAAQARPQSAPAPPAELTAIAQSVSHTGKNRQAWPAYHLNTCTRQPSRLMLAGA